MKYFYITTIIFAFPSFACAWHKPKYTELAKSSEGHALRKILDCPGEGGCSLTYEIVSPLGEQIKRFNISSDFSPEGGSGHENISVKQCQEALTELDTMIKKLKFPRVHVKQDSCSTHRYDAISIDNNEVHNPAKNSLSADSNRLP